MICRLRCGSIEEIKKPDCLAVFDGPDMTDRSGDRFAGGLKGSKGRRFWLRRFELVAMYINVVNLAKRMESPECQIRNTLPTRLLGLTLSWFEGR
jgi:hypothetical protein